MAGLIFDESVEEAINAPHRPLNRVKRAVKGASVEVFTSDGVTPATLYNDLALTSPVAGELTTNEEGMVIVKATTDRPYAPTATYVVAASKGSKSWEKPVILIDPAEIDIDVEIDLAAQMFGQLEVYGHSIPHGQTAGNPTRGFAHRVAALLHSEAANFSIGGSVLSAEEVALGTAGNGGWAHVYRVAKTGLLAKSATVYTGAPYEPWRDAALIQYGVNDLATLGPANLVPFKNALAAIISRLLASYIFEDTDAAITYTGSWTSVAASLSDGTLFGSNGTLKYSTTNGDKGSLAVPADYDGSPIALAFVTDQGGGGALWDIKVDGTLVGQHDTRNKQAKDYGTGLHGHTTPSVYRLSAAPGAHTVSWTINTVFSAGWFDAAWIETQQTPLVGVLKQHTPTTYAPFAAYPYNAAAGLGNADIATLNTAIQAVVDGFADLNVFTITPPALAGGDMVDGLHPNVRGHGLYASTVLSALLAAHRTQAAHARGAVAPQGLSSAPNSYYRNLIQPTRPDAPAAVEREYAGGTESGTAQHRWEDKDGNVKVEVMPGGGVRFAGDDTKKLQAVGAGGIGSTGALSSFAATLNQILIDHLSGFPKVSIPIGTASTGVSLNAATLDLYHVLNALTLHGGQYLNLSRAIGKQEADVLGALGDKLALYGGTLAGRIGVGVQSGVTVHYGPSGHRVSFREAAASGAASSGSTMAPVEAGDPMAAQDLVTRAYLEAMLPWRIEVNPLTDQAAKVGTWVIAANVVTQALDAYLLNTSLAISDSVSFDLVLAAGTWQVSMLYFKNNNAPQGKLTLDGTDIATFDQYAAALTVNQLLQASGTIAATGKKRLTVTLTGKNASSSNYFLALSWLTLRRTA